MTVSRKTQEAAARGVGSDGDPILPTFAEYALRAAVEGLRDPRIDAIEEAHAAGIGYLLLNEHDLQTAIRGMDAALANWKPIKKIDDESDKSAATTNSPLLAD